VTFGRLINILGIQESSHFARQNKSVWTKEYFKDWYLEAYTPEGKGFVVRYRNEGGVFDGTIEGDVVGKYISVDDNFGDLPITIGNYKILFDDVFNNIYFQTNFERSIL